MGSHTIERTERVEKLRNQVLQVPELCLERGRLMTESYMETEGEPDVIRRAKALKKILNEMTIGIDAAELIVGRTTSKTRGGPLIPEVAWEWYLEEIDTLSTRQWNKYAPLSDEEKKLMKEFLPYWKGKSISERFCASVPQEVLKLNHLILEAGGHGVNNIYQGHISVDFEEVLNKGLNGIKNKILLEMKLLNLARIADYEKYQFLQASTITLEAVSELALRYAQLARQKAAEEKNLSRKKELDQIAVCCEHVPSNPARSFHEALQSVWFVYVAVMIEGLSYGIGFGRPDQFLYKYYKDDLSSGKITDKEVRELIALLYIKINSTIVPVSLAAAASFGGHPLAANITVGGIDKNGRDAVNELSYLFLDAEKDVGLSAEDLIVRIHKNNPNTFVVKACEVAKTLQGKLKFLSDETTIQQLMADGKPVDYARNYVITGCNTPSVPGYSQDVPGALFNLPLMLELALNNGVSRITGEQIGPKTGDPGEFKTYEDVWEAYKIQVETFLPIVILFKNVDDQLFADFTPTVFQSTLVHGCIEKGLDITNGGTAPYLTHAISLSGAPTVGDSLAAIRKTVFEDKAISMPGLIEALDKNFQGEEKILSILQRAPKFGNDDDYVDSIVNDVLMHGSEEAAKYKGIAGSSTPVAAAVVTGDVPLGCVVGALPDGRKSGEPLSEGGISPYQGRNVSGPVATLRSVSKINHLKLTNGSVLNMRFNPDVVKDEDKVRKFASMLRVFCETGGALVQFNIVDTDTLKDAQRNPDKYKDLLVRVATYSAYFVELSTDLQNDIIARMEFGQI
jgi:choline trimethylamine-lyase